MLIVLAAVRIWNGRFYVNPDGVQYLDIADAYRRADWSAAINGYWSPMYSWILAAWLAVWRPSPFMESTSVHLLGLLIFVFSLGAFEYFVAELLAARRKLDADGPGLVPAVSDDSVRRIAYALFLWSWFFWLAYLVTPDLLMTGFVYFAAGLLLRIHGGDTRLATFAFLGGCLALAYFAKTAMFPLAFVFLGVAWISARRDLRVSRLMVALSAFVLVASPWIAILSLSKHRITFGDSGRLTHSWYTGPYEAPDLPFPDSTLPIHRPVRVLARPALFAVRSDVSGTNPFGFDPSYWFEGASLESQFRLVKQVRLFRRNAGFVWDMVMEESFLVVGAFALAYLFWKDGRKFRPNLASTWIVVIPGAAGILMYCLIWVDARYLASFIVTIWLGLFASFRRSSSPDGHAIGRALSLGIVVAVAFRVAPAFLETARATVHSISHPEAAAPDPEWVIARSLLRLGVHRGDRVAVVGHAAEAYWARVAGVRIIAVAPSSSSREDFELVPDSDMLLQPDGALTSAAVSAFRSTGARAIIARKVPRLMARHGWLALGGTGLFAYKLPDGDPVPLAPGLRTD